MKIPFQLIGWNEFDQFLGAMPTAKQKEVIASAYALIRQQALTQLEEDGSIEVGLDDFENAIRVSADRQDYNHDDAAVRRARSTIETSAVLSDEMNHWPSLMANNPIVNIDVSELGDSERGAVISATARMLQLLREEGTIPPFVLAIDEAHEFVPSGRTGASTAVVRDLVKTARHIGIGVMLMTQSPSELDSRTLRTCNTYITLALAQPEVKEIEGLLSDLSERSIEQIPNMEQGRAFVGTARDIMTHTVPVDIRERHSKDASETPNLFDDSKEWFNLNNPQAGASSESNIDDFA
jgi:DNA helicase HerA-like ATPase